jgi:hypothetical protein
MRKKEEGNLIQGMLQATKADADAPGVAGGWKVVGVARAVSKAIAATVVVANGSTKREDSMDTGTCEQSGKRGETSLLHLLQYLHPPGWLYPVRGEWHETQTDKAQT